MYRLTIVPILIIFNLEREAILKINVSNYAISVYLAQKENDSKMRIVVYYAHKIIGSKLNYNIYDKELLTIVEALRE